MKIFYLPGHGGQISNGLGQALVSRGYEVVGRETLGEFKKLDFTDQVDTIANDLKTHFWSEDAKIIANSYGGYLLLHALSKLDPYIGKILFLSPIVGEFSSEQIRMGFIPLLLNDSMNLRLLKSIPFRCTALFTLDQRTGKVILKVSQSSERCSVFRLQSLRM